MKLLSQISGIFLASLVSSAAIRVANFGTNSEPKLRLLSFGDGEPPSWKTEAEILELLRSRPPRHFFDVTGLPQTSSRTANSESKQFDYPPPSHKPEVTAILANVTIASMEKYLTNLTSFNNRYYKSPTGVSASEWVAKTMSDIATSYPASNASVSIFNHTFGPQGSVIARIPGTESGPVTILGAHLDSINLTDPMNGTAPGADDDGSGSVNLMEAFRVLVQAGFKPKTPVEFHWYAAEEVGLLGSQAIANSYKNSGTQVKGMLQLDMTAYTKPGEEATIALIPDFVDTRLNDFVKLLVENYLTIKWAMSAACGYACSDHASWNKEGYPAVFPTETRLGDDNPDIHKANDTVTSPGWSWNHTLAFTQLGVAFAYELSV